MNLGIYITTLSDTEQLNVINQFVDKIINNKNIYDVSIFYDNVAFNPGNTKCGMFNSTDLWSFNGNLIVTSLNGLNTSLKIVNNINLFYYYGWEKEKNVLNLLYALNNNIKIIARSEKDDKQIYRLTGIKAVGISENYNEILDILLRCEDEHKSNNNNVYQTA